MNSLIKNQIVLNQESSKKWDLYTSHREKVVALIKSKSESQNDRLCILGAGNCNDLDLNILSKRFREVHLVDFDNQAMNDGISRQGLNDCENLYAHGEIDLTGSLQFLSKFNQELEPSDSKVKDFIQKTELPLSINITEPFEVVASVCTLTQLIGAVIHGLGNNHPYFFDFILKIRNHHLEQLISLVKLKGWGLLITDIVSSGSFSEMANVPEEIFPDIVNQLIANQNFFHGVNPYRISSILSSNQLLSEVNTLRPWRWNFGPRIYAVSAIEMQRK